MQNLLIFFPYFNASSGVELEKPLVLQFNFIEPQLQNVVRFFGLCSEKFQLLQLGSEIKVWHRETINELDLWLDQSMLHVFRLPWSSIHSHHTCFLWCTLWVADNLGWLAAIQRFCGFSYFSAESIIFQLNLALEHLKFPVKSKLHLARWNCFLLDELFNGYCFFASRIFSLKSRYALVDLFAKLETRLCLTLFNFAPILAEFECESVELIEMVLNRLTHISMTY